MNPYAPRPRRFLLLVGAGQFAGLSAFAGPAPAAFPGANGRIAFARNSDIYVMNPDGHDATRLTTHPAIDSRPDWSPNGTKLAS